MTSPNLIDQLESKDITLKLEAIDALGVYGNDSASDSLISVLKNEEEPINIRQKAMKSIAKIYNVTNFDRSSQELNDKDLSIQFEAIEDFLARAKTYAIPNLTKEIFLDVLKHEDKVLRRLFVQRFATSPDFIDKDVLQALLSATNDECPKVRVEIINALAHFEFNDIEKTILQALKDVNENVRATAVRVLSDLRKEEAVDIILPAINDKHWVVRANIIESWRYLEFPQKRSLLINALKDPDEAVRVGAFSLLNEAFDEEADKLLIDAVYDKHWKVRTSVINSLERLDKVNLIENMTKDPIAEVRVEALKALEHIEDNNEIFLKALEDTNWKVRAQAVVCLKGVSDAKEALFERLNDVSLDVRMNAAVTLHQLKETARLTNFFIDKLSDQNWKVRKQAIYILKNIGGNESVAPIIKMLSDETRRIRADAAETLAVLGDTKAVLPLINSLNDNDDYVRLNAIEALGKLGDISAIPPLKVIAENDSDPICRKKSQEILAELAS